MGRPRLTKHCSPVRAQVIGQLLAGGRPPVPPADQLPGPDMAQFEGLDDYIQLMQECWGQDPAGRPCFPDIAERLDHQLQRHLSVCKQRAAAAAVAGA